MKRTAHLALLLALAAAPASAGRHEVEVGLNVGANIASRGDLAVGDFNDVFDPGISLAGHIAGPISGLLYWRGELGFDRLRATAGLFDGDDLDIVRFGGGFMLQPSRANRGRPYVYLTLGGFNQDLRIPGLADRDSRSQTDLGLSFGGGYTYAIRKTFGLGGDIRVNTVFSGDTAFDDTLWYVTPSVQVWLGF